ncbi:rhodanese-like protein [Streptococcus sp. oral taxon 058 str. F0407]|nr:rhodanese-like protein [Streptococcus sp. oral taxon 058 str. F0407]
MLEVPMFHLFTKIDSISTSELEAKLKEPIQLLDVRTPTEFHRGHIKNAKNVPLTEIGSYTPATKETLYVICHSGVRSKLAAKKLKKKGYDVINVRGGMSAWTGKVI